MGYYVNLLHTDTFIPASLFPTLCSHILSSDLMRPENMSGGCYGGPDDGKRWFSWCDMAALEKALAANDFIGVLECFRFDVICKTDTNDIEDLCFDCKCGDEEKLFRCIAAVLPDTHRFDWQGEGGERWRWIIKDNKMHWIDGITIFPGDDE